MVNDVLKAINSAPHVVTRSTREFADMFDVKRVLAVRSRAAVLTLVTRRYGTEQLPARMLDTLEMGSIGVTGVTPSDTLTSVPALDQTVDELGALLSDSLIGEAIGMYAEGDPQRVLVSPVSTQELQSLAACIAGEVDYTSMGVGPDADLRVSYVFRPDDDLTGWEDLVTTVVDGVAITDTYSNVLRLCRPYDGTGKYAVGNGLSEALSTGKPLSILGTVTKEWLSGGKEYDISVSYPKFEYDPRTGSRVTGIEQAKGPLKMSAFSLLGMAPLKSHALTIAPTTRARLADAARLFAFAYQSATGITDPLPYLHISPTPGGNTTLFRSDALGEAKRVAVLSQLQILYRDSLIRFLTSHSAKVAYSQAVIRANARAQTPTTTLEAKAYLDTVESYMLRFAAPFAGMPAQFSEVFRTIQADPHFEELATYQIIHPRRRGA
jgi:hypothetical protein